MLLRVDVGIDVASPYGCTRKEGQSFLCHGVLQVYQQNLVFVLADSQGHFLFFRNFDLMVGHHDLKVHIFVQRSGVNLIALACAEVNVEADEQHTAGPTFGHHLLMVDGDEGAGFESRVHLLLLVDLFGKWPFGWVELLRVVLPETVGDSQVLQH